MYDFVKDKEFLKNLKRTCGDIINQLVQAINNDDAMTVEANLVGSGAKNLITQNANEPIDLDYNLVILECKDINDTQSIKEYVRKEFNKVLNLNKWGDCSDSTSCLTTKKRYFTQGNKTIFSIDLAIIAEGNDCSWYRLIHEKTGSIDLDRWFWNQAPNSEQLNDKVAWLKSSGYWNEVRDTYLKKKNMYLSRHDNNHPSFNCYIETVNEIYDKYN